MKVITEGFDEKSDPQKLLTLSNWFGACPRKMTTDEKFEDEEEDVAFFSLFLFLSLSHRTTVLLRGV